MSVTTETKKPEGDSLASVLHLLSDEGRHGSEFARRQTAVVAFGRRTITRASTSLLMQDAVALVSEILGSDLAGIGEVVGNGRELLMTVATIDKDGQMVSPVSKQLPLDIASSISGHALLSATSVSTADLSRETEYTDLFLRSQGVCSAMVVPIHLDHEPLGTLGVYHREPHAFDIDDIAFAESISHLLASSVAREHAEQEAKSQRAFSETVVDVVDALVVVLDDEARIVRMNRSSESVLGFSSKEVVGKLFVETFLPSDQSVPFGQFFEGVRGGVTGCQFEAPLLTKAGEQRLTRWTAEEMFRGDEQSVTRQFILSGSDRTEQVQALDEVERLRSEAQRAGALLAEVRRRVAAGLPVDELLQVIPDRSGSASPGAGSEAPGAFDATPEREPSGGEPRAFQPVADQQPSGREMRRSPRRTYQYRQLVAPMLGDKLPDRRKFFEVVCQDISAGGISFLLDSEPPFKRVVVALGKPPRLSFFVAEIVRIQPQEVDGRRKYLIGCRFCNRVKE